MALPVISNSGNSWSGSLVDFIGSLTILVTAGTFLVKKLTEFFRAGRQLLEAARVKAKRTSSRRNTHSKRRISRWVKWAITLLFVACWITDLLQIVSDCRSAGSAQVSQRLALQYALDAGSLAFSTAGLWLIFVTVWLSLLSDASIDLFPSFVEILKGLVDDARQTHKGYSSIMRGLAEKVEELERGRVVELSESGDRVAGNDGPAGQPSK